MAQQSGRRRKEGSGLVTVGTVAAGAALVRTTATRPGERPAAIPKPSESSASSGKKSDEGREGRGGGGFERAAAVFANRTPGAIIFSPGKTPAF